MKTNTNVQNQKVILFYARHEGVAEVQPPSSLTSALDAKERSDPRSGRFIPERTLGTDCIGGWMGLSVFGEETKKHITVSSHYSN